jgi:chaperonin GroES
MNLRPLGDRVVVKALSQEEVTKSGIIMPATVDKERPERGEVIAIGPGKLLDSGAFAPVGVKVGDKIVFKKYAPDEIKIDKEEYLVISESDIMAVIE